MIKADHLQKCVDLCDKGRGTKKNMKTLALLMYKYAIKNDIAEKNYAEHIYVGKEQHNEKPFFSADEIKKIASAVGIVQNADTVLILIYTGFRINEFLNLKGSSYDPIEKTLTGGSKTEAGKDRVVTLSPKIESLVSALVTSDDAYLIRHNGGHCSDKIYRNDYYYPALKEIGVRPLPPHSCRHTFATLMKGVEAPATDKLKLIGHSKIEMTAYYTHTDLDSLRKITNNI